eukprot:IDg4127t1
MEKKARKNAVQLLYSGIKVSEVMRLSGVCKGSKCNKHITAVAMVSHVKGYMQKFVKAEQLFCLPIDGHLIELEQHGLKLQRNEFEVEQSPSEATHFIQPCDKNVNKSLKSPMRKDREILCTRSLIDTNSVQADHEIWEEELKIVSRNEASSTGKHDLFILLSEQNVLNQFLMDTGNIQRRQVLQNDKREKNEFIYGGALELCPTFGDILEQRKKREVKSRAAERLKRKQRIDKKQRAKLRDKNQTEKTRQDRSAAQKAAKKPKKNRNSEE